MASKLAAYETGYDDERFEQIVSETLHCIICAHVIKDPVMCQHNEHLFCRACITIHLLNFPTCPICVDPLTVETLRQPSRTVTNLLAELKIRCEFFDRGCKKFIQLRNLERHVADCGFAPAVCSNEGCQLVVNKQDLLHHETAVCELRRVKCHSWNNLRGEMDTVKVHLAVMNEKLDNNDKIVSGKLQKSEANVTAFVEKNLVAKVELVQQQLNQQEEIHDRLEADNVEIRKSLSGIMKQLESLIQQTPDEVQAEKMKKEIAEGGGTDREEMVVVAGGWNTRGKLSSVEMFSLRTRTWTQLQPMKEGRYGTSSVVYDSELFVVGGYIGSVEKLPINSVHMDVSIPWENIPVETIECLKLLIGHCSVVYNGRLIIIGGYDDGAYSDSITEITLVPLYTSELLATMPQKRCSHGVAIFGDKILIIGGKESKWSTSALRSVVMYDITKNECQELAPLPYPVYDMATVKWDDDNVMIMGGADSDDQPSNKVLMYDIKTQESHELPNMKYKRKGCVAAVVRDTVLVMGGQNERENALKSVEGFRIGRNSWEELPPMEENRFRATAVVC